MTLVIRFSFSNIALSLSSLSVISYNVQLKLDGRTIIIQIRIGFMFTDSFLSLHSSCLPAIPLSSFSPISSPSYFQSSLFSAPFPLLLALEINVLCMQTISISLNHFFSFGSIRCMCAAVVARLYSLLFHSILRALGTFCTTVVVPCFTQRGIDAFVCVCVRARE